jgi:phage-related protein
MTLILKIWTWIKVNAATVINALQLVVKAIKELLTSVINLISIFLPTVGAQKIVLAIRAFLEWVDSGLEWIKEKLNLIPLI